MKKSWWKSLAVVLSVMVLCSWLTPMRGWAEDDPPPLDEYVLSNAWGGEANVLNEPKDAAIGAEGRIYVVNRGLSRITVITPGEDVFNNFGNFGFSEGQLADPEAIAVDAEGFVYVACSWRVVKFTAAGEYVLGWGNFNGASGIAVGPDGYVYVADTYNHQIIKFDAAGVEQRRWGSEGTGDGQFNQPMGLAVDADNHLYVADSQNHRIQKFDADGTYITQWGSLGPEEGEFHWPMHVEISPQGEIFVSDWGNYRVQVFDDDLTFLAQWGIAGTEEPHFRSPRGMAFDAEGNIIVAVAGINLVHRYSPTYAFITQWGVQPNTPGQFYWPHDIVVDAEGHLYVADTNNRRIQKFNTDGVYEREWAITFEGINWAWPIKLALDAAGNVYVLDPGYAQVQKFSPSGEKFGDWQLAEGIIAVDQDFPTGLAIFEDDFLYISGGYNDQVHQFNLADGAHIRSWGGTGSDPGEFIYPFDVAVDPAGDVYVADDGNARIQKFDASGDFLAAWEEPVPGQFENMTAIKADPQGNLYVLDGVARRVQAFSAEGAFISEWQGLALAPEEQPHSPRGLAVDADGNLYLADTHNQRIQVLSPELPSEDPDSGLILNGGFDAGDAAPSAALGFQGTAGLTSDGERIDGVIPGLEHWTYGGQLPIERTTTSYEADYAVLLGLAAEQAGQGIGSAWITQVFYIPDGFAPVLTFNYKIFSSDPIENSDFIVEIQDAVGLNHKSTVVQDGWETSGGADSATTREEAAWTSVAFDLRPYRGRFVRLVMANRLKSLDSQGMWTYVENISVHQSSSSFESFLPLVRQ